LSIATTKAAGYINTYNVELHILTYEQIYENNKNHKTNKTEITTHNDRERVQETMI